MTNQKNMIDLRAKKIIRTPIKLRLHALSNEPLLQPKALSHQHGSRSIFAALELLLLRSQRPVPLDRQRGRRAVAKGSESTSRDVGIAARLAILAAAALNSRRS